MNVEGDFRYVDSGGFDECYDFLEYMNEAGDDWEKTFSGWIDVSKKWKVDQRMSRNSWDPWNIVKVLYYDFLFCCLEVRCKLGGPSHTTDSCVFHTDIHY